MYDGGDAGRTLSKSATICARADQLWRGSGSRFSKCEMRHASLFSGIGGFDLAADWMGWENVLQCEIDPFCQKALHHHFPTTTLYGDIREIDGTKYRGAIDVLTGGFPCQPFSAAGRRRGTEDNRFLWPEMLRVIREVQPTWIVAENVRGITSIDNGMVFERVCSELEEAEYEVQPFCIPACAVGAPHKRERIWFVANRYTGQQESTQETLQSGRDAHDGTPIAPSNRANVERERGERSGSGCGKSEAEIGDGDCDATNANDTRLEGCKITGSDGKNRKKPHDEHAGGCNRRHTTDTDKRRLEGSSLPGVRNIGEEERHARRWSSETWLEAATRLCRVDDGLPRELDGITIPKWSRESLKAYGNAIVPQVAFQIFKAIQSTYE